MSSDSRSGLALLIIGLFSAISHVFTIIQIIPYAWGGLPEDLGWIPFWLFPTKSSFTTFIVVLMLAFIQYLIVGSIKNRRWAIIGIGLILFIGWWVPYH